MRIALIALLSVGVGWAQQASSSLGAEPYSDSLAQQLATARGKRPADYVPRTRHRNDDGTPKFTNRLFLESSPYLLQHAHNPVDWHPWGDEAFDKARELGRPALLSVGYATCHWCHVMEEESFEDEEIARFINENYVAIKVDREQRPDVDGVYMAAVQVTTGGAGGWPMTAWLSPDRRPFYAGSYFPARDGDRGVTTGFLTLLNKLLGIYKEQPEIITTNSAVIAERIGLLLSPRPSDVEPAEAALTSAMAEYKRRFDAENGGLRGGPKFPSSLPIRLLLEEHKATQDAELLSMASSTLTAMAASGIRDHVGGGFHRYAVDYRWRVPHFEKMLYDNALLTSAYIEGWRATGDAAFAAVAREVLAYVSREMTSPQGAFYSATDADSLDAATGAREEGLYFSWTPHELQDALGADDAAIAEALWSVDDEAELEGRNVLRRERPLSEIATQFELTEADLAGKVKAIQQRLLAARASRPAPLRDDKILTAWNGLMISAYAQAAFAFDEPGYADAAGQAARFILDRMRIDGRLQRSSLAGIASGEGYLDDYAFLIAGLIDLYEATGEIDWLQQGIALSGVLDSHFANPAGGYYLTADDHEGLIVRQQPAYDSAEPSGNSVQVMNLLRLHEFTTDDAYRVRAERCFSAFAGALESSPTALGEMLRALRWRLSKPKQILFVAKTRVEAQQLASAIRATYVPQRIIAVAAESEIPALSATIPLLEDKLAIGGRPTAYVCEERVCKLPAFDPETLVRLLN
ncbi:MAG: thioredoxin domain-containing protein [Acidobacteria bacterium]|nr:thioredoxin domain-containing protein [Acidobacteriota bacterium]MDA1234739.1 thioredoxin domain-containing protein [Acidobacteriota bacterium]